MAPRRTRLVVVVALVAFLAVAAVALLARDAAPPARDLEARTLEVERQLLCPQCTSKRLDVCDQAICEDMRREIRARLERGETRAQILDFFSGRYGDRVLASVPKSGFNLWLWGWVLASIALAGLAAWSWLRGRAHPGRDTSTREASPREAVDDAWLDAQLRDAPDGPGVRGR